MLVLSRKLGERIVIGDNIVITVVGGAGDRVRLGISAPAGVPIHREEIRNRIQQEAVAPAKLPIASSRFFSECA
jgi:carbon storage regulator